MIAPLPNEGDLLKRCVKGSTEAFGELVAHYQDAIFNLVYRMIGHREDANDVTQEVFLRAFRKIGTFQGRSRFATWLYSIATNQAISERRKRSAAVRKGRVQMSTLAGDEGGSYDPPGDDPAPEEQMSAVEVRRQIEQAIDELPDDYRAVVVLRDVEELDYDGIADALNCSRGTVKSRLHRARLQLRRKLEQVLAEQRADR